MTSKRIWLSPPHMGGQESQFVKEAFDTNWIAPIGPHVNAFESELAAYLGERSQVAVLSSGTAAIHLALILLKVNPGDEVICSSFTFSGSCNPIAYLQAQPVFVDSEKETWNLDPELLRSAIQDRMHKSGKKPAAIIVVHLYGMPARMTEIMSIAAEYGIPVIEDAAEALGSEIEGQKCGTFGDFGILSFNGNKIITTSGGGALISRNGTWIEKAKFLSTQARDPAPHYEHSEIGYNYRLSNVSAAIGRGQLIVLPERVAQRRKIFELYQKNLNELMATTTTEPDGFFSNRWLSTVIFEDSSLSQQVRVSLEAENIETRPLWKPMHLQPVFRDCPKYVNGVSENLFNKGLCLPSGSAMDENDVSRVVSMAAKVIKQLQRREKN